MFGLRPDIDVANVRSLRPNSAPKTFKFAERLKDRFYVSGLSGGFRKHYSMQNLMLYTAVPGSRGGKENEAIGVNNIASKRLMYDEQLRQRKQEMEIQREQEQLRKLEQQLQEIRHKKELRQQRDASRMLRKMQHSRLQACTRIQRVWRRHHTRTREEGSAQLILSFLQTVRNRQIMYIASLSAGTLRRFASSAGEKWLAKRGRVEELSGEAAELAADVLQGELLDGCLEEQVDALMAALEEMEEEDEEGELESSYHKFFFITELEGPAAKPTAEESTAATALICAELLQAAEEAPESIPGSSMGAPADVEAQLGEEDDRAVRIALLHRQRLQAMRAERAKRLKLVASSKKEKVLVEQQKAQQKLIHDEQKEAARQAFFERLDAMQQLNAKQAASLRARKERMATERQRQAERRAAEQRIASEELARARRDNEERRRSELRLMCREDARPAAEIAAATPGAASAPSLLQRKDDADARESLPKVPPLPCADEERAPGPEDKEGAVVCARAKARRRMQERLRLDREQREREEAAEQARRDMQARVMEQAYALLHSAKKKKRKEKRRKKRAAQLFGRGDGNAQEDEELNELLERAEQQQQLLCDGPLVASQASAAPPLPLLCGAAALPGSGRTRAQRMPKQLRTTPYYADYKSSLKKAAGMRGQRRREKPVADRVDSDSLEESLDARARLGKVASLLAMVSRARRKAGEGSSRDVEVALAPRVVEPCAQLDFSGLEEPSTLVRYQYEEEPEWDEGAEEGACEEALDAECALLRSSLVAKMQALAQTAAPAAGKKSLEELFALVEHSVSFDDDVRMGAGDGPDDCSFEMTAEMLAQIYNDENMYR